MADAWQDLLGPNEVSPFKRLLGSFHRRRATINDPEGLNQLNNHAFMAGVQAHQQGYLAESEELFVLAREFADDARTLQDNQEVDE